jgi:hypothetical protein
MNKDNPPAFPTSDWDENDRAYKMHGITTRDYFAAKAMQGLIARESSGAFNFEACPNDPWRVAQWAYDVADAMMEARK